MIFVISDESFHPNGGRRLWLILTELLSASRPAFQLGQRPGVGAIRRGDPFMEDAVIELS